MLNLGPYGKTIIAVITAAITWAGIVVHSPADAITANEWLIGVTDLAIALGVFAISNAPQSTS